MRDENNGENDIATEGKKSLYRAKNAIAYGCCCCLCMLMFMLIAVLAYPDYLNLKVPSSQSLLFVVGLCLGVAGLVCCLGGYKEGRDDWKADKKQQANSRDVVVLIPGPTVDGTVAADIARLVPIIEEAAAAIELSNGEYSAKSPIKL